MGADGKTYAIPFTTDTFAMIYNKELLKAAGYEKFPTNWNDLRAASKAVMEKTGKAGWGFPAGTCGTPTIWFITNFYQWSKGWAYIEQQPNSTKYEMKITPDQIAEAFDYYKSYLDEGHNPKSNLSICLWGAPEIVEGMVNGEIAIASVPDTVARADHQRLQAAQPRQARSVGRRPASCRRQRIEDEFRRTSSRDQRQQQEPGSRRGS